MEDELTCRRCSRPLFREDSIIVAPDGTPSHLDCRAPRALNLEERSALGYCSGHPIAECARCRRRFRESDLAIHHRTHLCPSCREDLTESIRAHLDTCAMLPEEVRRRARAVREAAERLIKRSNELADRADVLMREAEATIAALRDTRRRPDSKDLEALRLAIRLKLADGRLPHRDIPPTIVGGPGNGSACAACDEIVPPGDLMMRIPFCAPQSLKASEMETITLHADCFQLWNQERRRLTPS